MRRRLVFIIDILILILVVNLLIFFASPDIAKKDTDKIQVITTIFPNYDFAKQIGKDKVEVININQSTSCSYCLNLVWKVILMNLLQKI